MTALHDRPSVFVTDAATDRSPSPASGHSLPFAVAGALSMVAFALGIVVAYLVFPEPTMWRVAVNAAVIAVAVAPIRSLFRRLADLSRRRLLMDAESDR